MARGIRNPHAVVGADAIRAGFDRYHETFLAITRRGKPRFEQRDWQGSLRDARERLDLYERVVGEVVVAVRRALGDREREEPLWGALRAAYSERIAGHPAGEVAETFFNSVTRRIFRTVGVNPAVEYLDYLFERVPSPLAQHPIRTYRIDRDADATVHRMLEDCRFAAPFADLPRDARRVAAEVARAWAAGQAPITIEDFDVLEPVFYRRKGAYVVGRARGANRIMPLVLALAHGSRGIAVDAVLCAEAEVSVVFSFTRSYFHAEVAQPAETIEFLRSVMPVKPVGELYSALGYNKHGKTEFYRELQRHLRRSDERFEIAPGSPGLVMAVFTLPSFDAVFKVIRDSFGAPKQTTPGEVKRRYELVFSHDRAGRLVDAQSFEGLSFPKARFSRALLAELLGAASRTVREEGDEIVIDHLYTERRVRPLDLYLRDAEEPDALRVVLDYGQSIRDLAATNVFPGDFLLKNFGVTRHGRVVFYDYDELRLLTECRFRDVPASRYPEDELSDEPWYHVGPDDVFPVELGRFIPFAGTLRDAFLRTHGALYTTAFWQDLQAQLVAGEIVDIYPYRQTARLP